MILFSDFDRTLFFRDDGAKTEENIEATKKWRDEGNQFCIVTGRSYKSITEHFPIIKEICDYYIVDGGSIIINKNGELIKAFYFDPAVVAGVVEFSKSFPEVPAAYYYTPNSEDADYKTENLTKLRLWFADVSLLNDMAAKIRESFPVFAFILAAGEPTHKALEGRKGFIEIVPNHLGKSYAIRFLQQEANIPADSIVTIGDGLNDYEMVRDFNGFAISGSELSDAFHELKTADSISSLIRSKL
ncbi:HAD-IIB family hydrolase [Candidatus Saccharibacteria bacterium]|nr:HAD-IIB family hydrolase [Candidatus Saccharibacteria bacterium]